MNELVVWLVGLYIWIVIFYGDKIVKMLRRLLND
jgi:hypothetical protein